jgi:hypothetical protein
MPSESAKHIATLKRVAVTDRTIWEALATRLHPNGKIIHSVDHQTVWLATKDSEDAMAVWSVEHQMGYVVL